MENEDGVWKFAETEYLIPQVEGLKAAEEAQQNE
jgi:hypothetical protein